MIIFREVLERINRLERRQALGRRAERNVPGTTEPAVASILPPVVNLLRNSDVLYSKDAYLNSPMVGGDAAQEAAHIYTGPVSLALLAESTARALKAAGHNSYSSADPDYDKANGVVRWGSQGTLDFPLARREVGPSQYCYCGFIARKASSSVVVPAGTKVRMGLWDNTDDGTGNARGFLRGDPFAVSGAVSGTAGSTATEYKVIATTDWGLNYVSNALAVPNAPDTLNSSSFVRLSWLPLIGVTRYDIYRLRGGAYHLIGEIRNGSTGWFDRGGNVRAEAGYPAVTETIHRAFVEIPFEPTTAWKAYAGLFVVPDTYNQSLTTGKQWYRMWMTLAAGLSVPRGLEFDKFFLSKQDGVWSPAAADSQTPNDISAAPTSSSQGGTGSTGGGGSPLPGRGGDREGLAPTV